MADAFEHHVRAARESAPEETALRQAIELTAFNAGLTDDLRERPPVIESDPLVELSWIDGTALSAARDELKDVVEARARSPWGWSTRIGVGPLDALAASHDQATWAGALWKLRSLRRQVGAQVMLGAHGDPAAGLTMWLLGGGRAISAVVRREERRFGRDTADSIWEAAAKEEAFDRNGAMLVSEISLACWDLLSSDVLARALRRVAPRVRQPEDNATALWGLAALRAPDAWRGLIKTLDQPALGAVVARLPAGAVDGLDYETAAVLLQATEQLDAQSSAGTRVAATRVALWAKVNATAWEGPLEARVVAEIAESWPTAESATAPILDKETLRRAEVEIVSALEREVGEAMRGRHTLGQVPRAYALSVVCLARGNAEPETRRRLVDLARDTASPANLRIEALGAIARMASRGLYESADLQLLRSGLDVGEPSAFKPVGDTLLRAGQLLACAAILDEAATHELKILARDADPRVRQTAVNGAALVLRERPSEAAADVLITGLFDPEELVVESALAGLPAVSRTDTPVLHTAFKRIDALYSGFGRDVRAACIHALRAFGDLGDHDLADRLIKDALQDRSWVVRRAASGPLDV